jgi:CBS domain-containing protein
MIKEKIGCLPVVNTENKLVGIVTEQDFLPIAASYFQLGEQLHKP